jgi:hypothetical protein
MPSALPAKSAKQIRAIVMGSCAISTHARHCYSCLMKMSEAFPMTGLAINASKSFPNQIRASSTSTSFLPPNQLLVPSLKGHSSIPAHLHSSISGIFCKNSKG